jgi:hypothetical protein
MIAKLRRSLLIPAAILSILPLSAQLHVDEAAVRFSFPADHFLAEVPIANGGSPVSGHIAVELLDTRNGVRSRADAPCALRTGTTICSISLPQADPETVNKNDDEIARFRVRYTILTPSWAPVGGTLALDHIAPTLYILHAATASQIRPGGFYSLRIRATHPLTYVPQPGVSLEATVTASIESKAKDALVEHKRLTTGRDGFATLDFTAPAAPDLDSIAITIEGRLTNLHTAIDQTVKAPIQRSLALTTDKPLYQPGQTVHLRLLCIDRRGRAQADAKLRLDVRDPDDTLVFRTETATSHFGIASADWQVPARLRLGSYTVAASTVAGSSTAASNDDESSNTSARAQIRISRYDLPTFTVAPKPDKPFYLPGQNAAVEVRANYLFGKPVLHGHVRVVRETDRTWNFENQKYNTEEGAVYKGELDKTGAFTAHVDLSADEKKNRGDDYHFDQNAFKDLHLAAYVTDASTGRTEQRRFDLRISRRPLHVYLLRDASYPAGLPLGFTISVTTADGVPAPNAAVRIALLPRTSYDPKEPVNLRTAHALELTTVHTNSYGLARVDGLPVYADLLQRMPAPVLPLKPDTGVEENAPRPELLLSAQTADGRAGSMTEQFDEPSTILRLTTDHALYKPGDPIRVTVSSAQPDLPVNVQLLRNTQAGLVTLATENVTLHSRRATLTLSSGQPDTPDPRFTGYITVAAVALAYEQTTRTPWGYEQETSATAFRTILFPRDNALHVAVKLAHDTYRPGDTATATIDVKGPQDSDGDDNSTARTALGVVVVDQAVNERNRSDSEFGSGDNFFLPWRSAFYSSRTVAGLFLADIEQRDPSKPFTPDLDLAAGVLLNDNQRYGRSPLELTDNVSKSGLAELFSLVINQQIGQSRKAIENYLQTHTEVPTTIPELDALLAPNKLSISGLRDPWDKPFQLTRSINYSQLYLQLVSDGPDKLAGSGDDFSVPLAQWNWFAGHESDLRRVLIDHHQRTHAFIRDFPTLTAAMQADHIDFASWRDAWGQPLTYSFSVNNSEYVVSATTLGEPPAKGQVHRGSFEAGSASISWFTDVRFLVQNALTSYAEAHPFPTSEAELDAAMRRFGVSPAKLIDPWGHALFPAFHTRSIFTDRVTVEARGSAGETPQKHTTVTPVTAVVDTVDLDSMGPDGKRDVDFDNFIAASFSHIRSQQAAKEAAPQPAAVGAVESGESVISTGALTGSITDQSAAVIPNATVIATNDATKAEFQGQSASDGSYLLGPLPAGQYTVRVEMPAFQTTVVDQVHVLSPDATVLDVVLHVGAVNEMVMVSAPSVMLSTESSSVSGVAGMSGGVLGAAYHNNFAGKARVSFADLGAPPPPPPPGALGTPRVREYFPETLLWRPEVLTTDDGSASIRFPVADTITSWQLSVAASTLRGNTGGGVSGFSTFLPFFAAFDPPQTLTIGDRLALPITLRNYLDHPVTVRSTLTPAPWLRVDTPPATALVPAQDSASPTTRITALVPVTNGKLLFTARPDALPGDSIERPITIHPDGLETAVTTAGIVSGPTTFFLTIPADALDGGDATLKLYPNLPAHLRDALVAMAAFPDGCAEQIISIAWPSLLLERYAAKLPAPDKQLQAQTRLRLEAAYANLLADRDSSGGFRYWPHDARPDLALTAYAVQFLVSAHEFIAVDDDVIKSAVDFLAKQQSGGGLWIELDREGKPRPKNADGNAMLTASIAAMLAGAPGSGSLLAKALTATQPFTDSIDEPYTLANYALAAIAAKDTARSGPAIAHLRSLALSENGGSYWALETNTPFFGWGRAGRVEATAATLRALLAAGAMPHDDLITRGLLFLDHQQDRHSLWYSTQATARTLDVLAAIALGSETAAPRNAKSGNLAVRVDGALIATVALPSADKDVGPLFIPLGSTLSPGEHKVTLEAPAGTSPASAQIVANLYTPWPKSAPISSTTNNEQLHLTVSFNNTTAAPGTPIHAIAHIERLGFRGYGMLIAEVGLPPGADVDRASLETAVADSGYTLNHYEVLPDKLLVYLWPPAGGFDLHFTFSLRYAIDALTAPSVVYDYYNPDARFDLPPQRFSSLR